MTGIEDRERTEMPEEDWRQQKLTGKAEKGLKCQKKTGGNKK